MKSTPKIQLGNLRFLVVEDQGFQRWMVAQLLREMGAASVVSANDGREALDTYRDALPPIDIVVTDLNMPGMDGMQFIRHLGDFSTPASVILASALDASLVASVETMTRAYGVNLLGTVSKPVTAAKLATLLRDFTPPATRPRASAELPGLGLDEMAVGLRNGEFEPFLQGKVDVQTNAVTGAEALARWRHPLYGILGPGSFIRKLEASPLIDALTHAMLGKAARHCVEWRAAGVDATVSVNLSVRSLATDGFAERVLETVQQAGLDPRCVVLEVTETVAATHLGTVLENLSRLRMKGFGLSIDDYGTGYSSMTQLISIPFTELKIDGSFVENACTQSTSLAVVESSLEIAAKLGLISVAEGVETAEQLGLLRHLGCDRAQGFHISRPMPAYDFLHWATRHRNRPAEDSRLRSGVK